MSLTSASFTRAGLCNNDEGDSDDVDSSDDGDQGGGAYHTPMGAADGDAGP